MVPLEAVDGRAMIDLPPIERLVLNDVGPTIQPEAIALSERMAAGIPGARLLQVQGAGHHANLEAPDAVLAEIRRWLARHAASVDVEDAA